MRRSLVKLGVTASLAVLLALAVWGLRSGAPPVAPLAVAGSRTPAPSAPVTTETTAGHDREPAPAEPGQPRGNAAPARVVLPRRLPGVAGTVRAPDGRPVADAIVVVLQTGERKTPVPLAEITDAGGAFRVGTRAIAAGATLIAQHREYPPASIELTEEQVHGTPIELRFTPGIVFTGRLVSTVGRPIGAARVEASTAIIGPVPGLRVFDPDAQSAKHGVFTTDRDGRFTCRGWPAGSPAHLRIGKEDDRKFEAVRATVGQVGDVDHFVIEPTDGASVTLVLRVRRRVRIDVRGDAGELAAPVRERIRASIRPDDGRSRRLRLRWEGHRFRAHTDLLLEDGTRRTCELVFGDVDGFERRFGPYVVDGPTGIGDLVLR